MTHKLPPEGSNRFKVLKAINDHGPMDLFGVLKLMPKIGYNAVRAALVGERQMGLLKFQDGVWSLESGVEGLMKKDETPKEVYVGEIVPPREAPAMTNGLSPKNQFWNAPRREPIREISFVSCGSSFVPWPEVA